VWMGWDWDGGFGRRRFFHSMSIVERKGETKTIEIEEFNDGNRDDRQSPTQANGRVESL
jgi:hypothetical protein